MFLNGITGPIRQNGITIRKGCPIYGRSARALYLNFLRTSFRINRINVNMTVTFNFTRTCTIGSKDVIRKIQSSNIFLNRRKLRRATVNIRADNMRGNIFDLRMIKSNYFRLLISILYSTSRTCKQRTMSTTFRGLLNNNGRPQIIKRSRMVINARIRRLFTFCTSNDLLYALGRSLFLMRSNFFCFDGYLTRVIFRFAMRDVLFFEWCIIVAFPAGGVVFLKVGGVGVTRV